MKRVAAFVGSPRKSGNIATIVGEMARGAQEVGAEFRVHNLADLDIQPCRGCFACRKAERCALQDEGMLTVYEGIKTADAVVIGAPIYFRQVNAQTKLMLERLFPLTGPDFKPRFSVKKAILVYAQDNKDRDAYKDCFAQTAETLRFYGFEITDTFVFAGSSIPGGTAGDDGEMLARAHEAGRKLAG